jgi:hypothetical protein
MSLCNFTLGLRFMSTVFSKTLLHDLKYALVLFRVNGPVNCRSSFSMHSGGQVPASTGRTSYGVSSPDRCSSLIEGFVLPYKARLKVYQRDSIPACPSVRC